MPAHMIGDRQHDPGLFGGVSHCLCAFAVRRHRLFRQDVLASARRLDCLIGVQLVRRGDQYGVQFRVSQQCVQVIICWRVRTSPMASGKVARPVQIAAIDAVKLRTGRECQGRGQLHIGDLACGDHGDIQCHSGAPSLRCPRFNSKNAGRQPNLDGTVQAHDLSSSWKPGDH